MADAILTVAEMIAAEQALIGAGTSVDELMLRAGRGAGQWVWRVTAGRPVTILCGPGNNGGDGYVIAEYIRAFGGAVRVVAPVPPGTEAARNARAAFLGEVSQSGTGLDGSVLVDCLFGSGLARPLDDGMTSLLLSLAACHPVRIAIDLPSGVESDTGKPLNEGLPDYHVTLALGAWKFAHWLMPAAAKMGARRLVPIGVPEGLGNASVLHRPLVQKPAADAHKYRRGLLAVVVGKMTGAALLSARAAMHGGAGYVKLLATAPLSNAPADLVVETEGLQQSLADERMTALLVGPGLGRDDAARELVRNVLAANRPVVLDADALMVLAPDMLAARTAPVIATPHEGELAHLAATFAVAECDKLASARALSERSGMVIVAKGPDTIIAEPSGQATLAPAASSWLSVAGTGDVLAGLVASRLSTGMGAVTAAREAVWLHGEAGRIAGAAFTARELADAVPAALAETL